MLLQYLSDTSEQLHYDSLLYYHHAHVTDVESEVVAPGDFTAEPG